ncbi:hypothetical protein AcW2_005825 [Taiwanofungus camphoratus]|nr:hypothetical protein AcW2_005825 [Antrodia cinnamomea]
MHAYGHVWSCQLVYNPQIREGLGLSDGEGVERLWSKLRVIIGPSRTSVRGWRGWLIDRQVHAIGKEMHLDLGNFIAHKLRLGINPQVMAAQREVEASGVPMPVLREQWQLQREAQMSIRAHAPAHLKKELDVVLALQAEIDKLEIAFESACTHLVANSALQASLTIMQSLQATHKQLIQHVEGLYSSLNIYDRFPELEGLGVNFVRTLLLARDVKINIRKRAAAHFLEWDRLDRVSGGRDNPLGMLLPSSSKANVSNNLHSQELSYISRPVR